MKLERFAIRHKPTGNFLPLTLNNHTEAEPQPDCIPRLFDSRASASSALSRWLEGIWSLNHYRTSGDWGDEWDYDWGPQIKPENPRVKEDMEVVKVEVLIEVRK